MGQTASVDTSHAATQENDRDPRQSKRRLELPTREKDEKDEDTRRNEGGKRREKRETRGRDEKEARHQRRGRGRKRGEGEREEEGGASRASAAVGERVPM